jgi:hypothetical protein
MKQNLKIFVTPLNGGEREEEYGTKADTEIAVAGTDIRIRPMGTIGIKLQFVYGPASPLFRMEITHARLLADSSLSRYFPVFRHVTEIWSQLRDDIIDEFLEREMAYYVREMPGRNLNDLIRKKELNAMNIREIWDAIVEMRNALHKSRQDQRNIKPEDIMIVSNTQTFGRSFASKTITRYTVYIGTPRIDQVVESSNWENVLNALIESCRWKDDEEKKEFIGKLGNSKLVVHYQL